MVEGDWSSVRKHSSLSAKSERWAGYDVPAKGFGTHRWLLEAPRTVRMTQGELEAHPEWRNFDRESGRHPPMRGWPATPLTDRAGKVWGLLRMSDKVEGEFDARDEAAFERLAGLTSAALEALWEVRCLRKG